MKDGIGIIGYGVVGKSLVRLFTSSERNTPRIAVYDPAHHLIDKAAVNARHITFIAVPTNPLPDGRCDTSIVEQAVAWCESDIIVIRSTIEPGTTDRLRNAYSKRLIFQPEYLGETAAHPLTNTPDQGFSVLGGPMEDTTEVAELYKRFYHASHHFYFCSAICAELTKYMENAFYATKVMFCNEFFSIAKAFGVDFNELRETWLADPRISRDHTFVYPDNRGFSGKCLPKDTSAIIQASRNMGYDPTLLIAVMNANLALRPDDKTLDIYRTIATGEIPQLQSNQPTLWPPASESVSGL